MFFTLKSKFLAKFCMQYKEVSECKNKFKQNFTGVKINCWLNYGGYVSLFSCRLAVKFTAVLRLPKKILLGSKKWWLRTLPQGHHCNNYRHKLTGLFCSIENTNLRELAIVSQQESTVNNKRLVLTGWMMNRFDVLRLSM